MTTKKQERTPFNTNASLGASNIKYFSITDQSGESIDLTGSITQFYFYESVLSNYVSATVEIVDSGYISINGELRASPGGILGNLPKKNKKRRVPSIVGGNRVDFDIIDNNYNNRRDGALSNLSMLEGMYVSRIRDISTSTMRNNFAIDLVAKEALNNELTRVTKRYDGKISDSVEKILKEVMGVREDLIEVEETALEYNFIGNDSKPFNVCTKLANKSVPLPINTPTSTIGRKAGYIFFQTRLGMHFVSLANRHVGEDVEPNKSKKVENIIRTKEAQKYKFPVKFFVSTSASTIDEENGDDLILSYTIDSTTDVQKDLALGSYSNRSLFFDFYSMDYKVRDYNIEDDMLSSFPQEKRSEIKNFYEEYNPEFRSLPVKGLRQSPSRLMTHILNVGTLPKGVNSDAELMEWKSNPSDPTYDATKSMVQSIMQYNNLFREKVNIVVAGDFSMVAGNIIHCSFEAVGAGGADIGNDPEEDKNLTGYYIIANVCHRVTSGDTLTSMDLVSTARVI